MPYGIYFSGFEPMTYILMAYMKTNPSGPQLLYRIMLIVQNPLPNIMEKPAETAKIHFLSEHFLMNFKKKVYQVS